MNPSIEDIFNDALELAGEARAEFLSRVCAGNPALRIEAEALLEAYESSADLNLPTALSPPSHIGAYPIVGELGRGSMGIVYHARDPVLGRDLALKVLPASLASDSSWIVRLEREARTLASLNHPNIATIYSFEEADGVHFITMELVEGWTLAERLRQGALTVEETVSICVQVAAALEAAHAKGVVHRDLKPLNIRVTPNGVAKLLDFGIARRVEEAVAHSTPMPLGLGSHLAGTPGYMSPEQATGLHVDHRADVWALGCILYECVAGRRVEADREPIYPDEVGGEFRALVADCLVPDPDGRLASARVLRQRLERLPLTDASSPAAVEGRAAYRRGRTNHEPPRFAPRRLITWLVGIAIPVAAAGWFLFRKSNPPGVERATHHAQLTFTGVAARPEVTPDGRSIAYISTTIPTRNEIRVQMRDQSASLLVFEAWSIHGLRWMPNGRQLLVSGHVAGRNVRQTFLVEAGEENPIRVFDRSGPIACAPDGRSFAALSSGAEDSIAITSLDDAGANWKFGVEGGVGALDWSPDGSWLLVLSHDGGRLWTVRADRGRAGGGHPDGQRADEANRQEIDLASVVVTPRWSPNGRAIYFVAFADGGLWKIPIDRRTGMSAGPPISVQAGLHPSSFSISADGTLVYARGPSQSNLHLIDLIADDERALTSGTLTHTSPRFSPSGESLLFVRRTPNRSAELVVTDLADGHERVLYVGESCESPVWSPDAERISFTSFEGGQGAICTVDLASGQMERHLDEAVGTMLAWQPASLLLCQLPDRRNYRLLDPSRAEPRLLLRDDTSRFLWQAEPAPDGEHVAVLETESAGFDGPRVLDISLEDASTEVLYEGLATPIGWSRDEEWLYLIAQQTPAAVPGGSSGATESALRILRVPGNGGPPEFVTSMPNRARAWSSVDISSDGRWVVYSADEFVSDVWVMEHFDPDL